MNLPSNETDDELIFSSRKLSLKINTTVAYTDADTNVDGKIDATAHAHANDGLSMIFRTLEI